MSDAFSFGEIEAQQVELLPARTVLSLFVTGAASGTGTPGATGGGTNGGSGGIGTPGIGSNIWSGMVFLFGAGNASAGNAAGGAGGAGGHP
jgi:hypothetical protein